MIMLNERVYSPNPDDDDHFGERFVAQRRFKKFVLQIVISV